MYPGGCYSDDATKYESSFFKNLSGNLISNKHPWKVQILNTRKYTKTSKLCADWMWILVLVLCHLNENLQFSENWRFACYCLSLSLSLINLNSSKIPRNKVFCFVLYTKVIRAIQIIRDIQRDGVQKNHECLKQRCPT